MTEEQAVTKWCPFSRVMDFTAHDELSGGGNRWHDIDTRFPPATHCVGSRCMAWRWYVQRGIGTYQSAAELHGYCGLADKPTD